MSEEGTPQERRDLWAKREALNEAALGNIRVDQADDYAHRLSKTMAGEFKALEYAIDDLKQAMPTVMRKLFGWNKPNP